MLIFFICKLKLYFVQRTFFIESVVNRFCLEFL